MALIDALPGGFSTILSQDALQSALRTLGTRFWAGGRLLVSGAGKAFDAAGDLTDEATRVRLRIFLRDYAAPLGSA